MADDSRPQNTINWKVILVTAIVTGLVTIIVNVVVQWIQAKEPKLVYTVAQTIPFPGQNEVVGIYQISIVNEGKKEVDGVSCLMRIPNALIKERRILSDPSLNISDVVTNDALSLTISSINPDERIQVSILASAPKNLPSSPEISLRARGITGYLKSEKSKPYNGLISILSSLVGVLTGMLALLKLLESSGKQLIDGAKHTEQKDVLAYLCLLHGLEPEAKRFLSYRKEAKYWIEADRLTFTAIKSQSTDICDKTKNILLAIPKCATIANSSAAIAMLNAAKIEAFLGNKTEAKRLANEALKLHRTIIDMRKSVDPEVSKIFDT